MQVGGPLLFSIQLHYMPQYPGYVQILVQFQCTVSSPDKHNGNQECLFDMPMVSLTSCLQKLCNYYIV